MFGLTGDSITAEKAFLVVSMFNTVRLSMTLFFPMAISQLRELRASIKRIQVINANNSRDFHKADYRTSFSWRRSWSHQLIMTNLLQKLIQAKKRRTAWF